MDYEALLFVPKDLNEILGNRSAIESLRSFASSVDKGRKMKPIMVYGPPGTGKSAAVYALAKEHSWRIVELSASDNRDGDVINRVLAPAANSNSIYGQRNLLVLDEIDELAARFDSGASAALVKLINNSRNPIIFTANDFWDRRISFLRSVVEPIEFKKIDIKLIAELLHSVARQRKMDVKKDIIDGLAQRSNGDVRSALNDLSAFVGCDEKQEEIMYCIGQRNVKKDVFYTLDKIFFSNTLTVPLIAAANCDLEKDMLIRWVEENIAKRYKDPKDLSSAFSSLSQASKFSSRAAETHQYGLWRYMSVMLSSGVALAKTSYPSNSERYTFPQLLNTLSRAKAGKDKEISIAEKLKKKIHSNLREIRRSVLPLLSGMANAAQEEKTALYEFFNRSYGLEKDEVEFIKDLPVHA